MKMIFKELDIEEAFLIFAKPFIDERGSFRRHFCEQEFREYGLDTNVSQGGISENLNKHTLRGFHYLENPYSEAKTISCLNGSIYDVIVDLRMNSKTYLQWVGVTLSSNEKNSVHVPSGCANAFLTLEDNSLIHYYFSKPYIKDAERGFRYDDSKFNIVWPHRPKYLSEKDKNWANFSTPGDVDLK